MENKTTIKIEQISSADLLNWMEAYIISGQSTRLSLNTIRFYRDGLNKFFQFCAKKEVDTLEEITPNIIRQYLIFLENKGHNPGGVHANYRIIRAFFNWIEIELDDVEFRNPMRKIKVRKVNVEPLEPADINAVKRILATCEVNKGDAHWHKTIEFMNLRDKAIIHFLLDTGARASELLNMTVDNVNPITGAVQIVHGKGGKSRMVYIGRKTRQVYRKYIKKYPPNGYLFIGAKNNQPLTKNALNIMLARRAKQAGVPKQSPHSFRRLFALTMLRNGVDIYSLQMLMGHSDLQVLKRYLKLTQTDGQKAHLKGSPVEKLL